MAIQLLHSLGQLLGNAGANMVSNATGAVAQVNPFDHGATFANPYGNGNQGKSPLTVPLNRVPQAQQKPLTLASPHVLVYDGVQYADPAGRSLLSPNGQPNIRGEAFGNPNGAWTPSQYVALPLRQPGLPALPHLPYIGE